MDMKFTLVVGLLALHAIPAHAAYLCTDGKGNDYYQDRPCETGHASPRQRPEEIAREMEMRRAEAARRGTVPACRVENLPPPRRAPSSTAQSASASCGVGRPKEARRASDA